MHGLAHIFVHTYYFGRDKQQKDRKILTIGTRFQITIFNVFKPRCKSPIEIKGSDMIEHFCPELYVQYRGIIKGVDVDNDHHLTRKYKVHW